MLQLVRVHAEVEVDCMTDKNLAPVCGLYCGSCSYFDGQCPGCGQVKGRPFWTQMMHIDVCPLYSCCVETKQLEHCGMCGDFPCRAFLELRDPSMTDEEAEESLRARKNALARRRELGTDDWLKQQA